VAKLTEDKDNKKAKEGFIEAARVIELMVFTEVEGLAETMFKGDLKWDYRQISSILSFLQTCPTRSEGRRRNG